MGAQKRGWRVYCVFAVLLAGFGTVPAYAVQIDFYLSHTTVQDTATRITYHYILDVSDTSILSVGQSTLQMRGMDGVLSQGDANFWKNAGITTTSATWVYNTATRFRTFRYFDIDVDPRLTKTGIVEYELDAETGQIGTVVGPVAIDPPEVYSVSGTVYLDGDGSGGLYNPPTDSVLPGVTVELIHSEDGVLATTVSNLEINLEGEGYIGNYVFSNVPPGEYGVVVPDTVEYAGATLTPTTNTLQWITVTAAPVRNIDFGYLAPEDEVSVEVSAVVFFDLNRNGEFDEGEIGFDQVGVTLSGEEIETLLTGGGGYASFGEQGIGDYSISVTEGGPYKLLQYWTATTATSFDFSIEADTEGPLVFEFGFYPDADSIKNGDITGLNKTIGFWMHNIDFAIKGQTNGVQVSEANLLAWLAEVEGLFFADPYDFGGDKLAGAYWYLHPRESGNTPLARLARQLLAAELNWVSGFNSSEPDLEYLLLWWAEWVYNNDAEMAGEVADLMDWWNNLGNM